MECLEPCLNAIHLQKVDIAQPGVPVHCVLFGLRGDQADVCSLPIGRGAFVRPQRHPLLGWLMLLLSTLRFLSRGDPASTNGIKSV